MRLSRTGKAFTLIELVMVIVIIGIIVAIAVPKIADLQQKAINRSEQALMAALKTAINIKHMQSIVEHPDQDPDTLWPCRTADENPFQLLQNPPKYVTENDNSKSWGLGYDAGSNRWLIKCPCTGNNNNKFNQWCYYYDDYLFEKAGKFYFAWHPVFSHSTHEEADV